MHASTRKFWCVYTFPTDDFQVQGLYSNRDEAVALAKEINPHFTFETMPSSEDQSCKIWVIEQTLDWIIHNILSERLGKLYEPLAKLAGIMQLPDADE